MNIDFYSKVNKLVCITSIIQLEAEAQAKLSYFQGIKNDQAYLVILS